jgi:hypothetical protein
MDSVLLFQILEYLDEYDINSIFNIYPYQTNIQDLIDIIYNTKYIKERKELLKWKKIFTYEILYEYNMLFLYIEPYIMYSNQLNITNKINYIKQKKLIQFEIRHLFNGYYSKILQSRIPIKYFIKNQNNITMPSILKLEFKIMREFKNFKFLE